MAGTIPYSNPASYQQWAADLEAYMGLPTTATETNIISAWEQAENPVSQVGGYTSHGGYNALNTSLKTGSSGLEPGSSFIPTFPNIQAALAATSSTLEQGNYAPELAALQQQSGQGLVNALGSPGHVWGTSPSLVAEILHTGPSTAQGGTGGSPASTSANLASLPGGALDPLNWPGEIGGAVGSAGGGAVASGLLSVIDAVTAPLKAFVEDAGLVVLGIVLFFVALFLIARGVSSGGGTTVVEEKSTTSTAGSSGGGSSTSSTKTETKTTEKQPQSSKEKTAGGGGGGVKSEGDARALEGEASRAPEAVAAAAA